MITLLAIPRSCAYLDIRGKFGFRSLIGFQKYMPGSGRLRASNWCQFTRLMNMLLTWTHGLSGWLFVS